MEGEGRGFLTQNVGRPPRRPEGTEVTISQMRIGILGIDPITLELARHLSNDSAGQGSGRSPNNHSASGPSHQPVHPDAPVRPFVLSVICDDAANPWSQQFDCRHLAESLWTALLEDAAVDAVIVGGIDWPERRLEQLKQLLQAEIPVLVSWPHGDPLTVFELDMVRQSYGGVLTAVTPLSHHPAVEQLAVLAQADHSHVGSNEPTVPVEQLVLERRLEDRSQSAVLAQVSEDIDLLRRIVGNLTHVTAAGVSPDSDSWGNLVLQAQSTRGIPVRWIASHDAPSWCFKLSLIGARGQVTWEAETAGRDAKLTSTAAEFQSREWPSWPWERVVLGKFAEAMRGKAADPSWSEVCRCVEVVDATQRSVARGRRIDLTGQTVTEKDTFRGVMSATGCFLLLACILVVIGLAVVEGFRLASRGTWVPASTANNAGPNGLASGGSNNPNAVPATSTAPRPIPYWAIVLAVPLVGFLLLQFLQLVIRRPRGDFADRVKSED